MFWSRNISATLRLRSFSNRTFPDCIMITRTSRHRQVVGSLEDAETLLLEEMNSLPVIQQLSKKTVEEIHDQPNMPAVITTPIIRYRRPEAEEVSKVAATIDQLGQQFFWKADECTLHYERHYIKQCYPQGTGESDNDYCELIQRCIRPPYRLHDPQLYFTTGRAYWMAFR